MGDSKIRMSKEEYEKQFIQDELMRYYFYIDKRDEYKKEVDEFKSIYREAINDPSFGGSVAKMPDGSPDNSHIVIKLGGKLFDLESNFKYYENRVNTLVMWLGMLTEKQKRMALVYFCEYQCNNIHEAALELDYAEDTVKHCVKPIVNRIYKKFKKII